MEPSGTQTATDAAPAPGPPAIHKRRVKNYLINNRLQFRFASWLLAVAAMISVVLGWVLWRSYAETSRVVALADPEVAEALSAAFASEDRARMVWLTAALAVVLVCLLGFSIVLTHRIAGPAFIIARTCRQVGEGNLSRPRPLRDRDMLVELGNDVVAMVDSIRDRETIEQERITAIAARLSDPNLGESARRAEIAQLEQIVAEKAKRLGT